MAHFFCALSFERNLFFDRRFLLNTSCLEQQTGKILYLIVSRTLLISTYKKICHQKLLEIYKTCDFVISSIFFCYN